MSLYEFIKICNEENYECPVSATSENELINKMKKYLINEGLEEEEEATELDTHWEGEGTYCLVGRGFGINSVYKIEVCVENELENFNFPFNINLDFFKDFNKWVNDIKKENKCNYIYLVNHVIHRVVPNEYIIKYILCSNNKIENPINLLLERGIFVGEFDSLGANYFVEEIGELDCGEGITQYKIDADIKFIEIE
ncbi:TPA: hypothetical protein ACMU2U_001418 [Clostridioides difficile]|nr:hypothetical protein [Clostridioides difficile]MCI4304774.1 hypothetical protein [Clostridioides difficile]MCM4101578.1 hypothetical protein [Clostridioides difficile]HBG2405024.1 hypothetical protein [Clostridioides difficile]HDF4164008.1 hypothetical protein [Clostridioides difficile]